LYLAYIKAAWGLTLLPLFYLKACFGFNVMGNIAYCMMCLLWKLCGRCILWKSGGEAVRANQTITCKQYTTGWDVRVYPLDELCGYRYTVIFARYQDKWLYCRAKARDTYETAGGHIEKGETPLEAAKREFYEETGAVKFDIKPVFDYTVYRENDFANGQVFLADVEELGEMPGYEMAEVKLFDTIPDKMRFPQILPVLFEKVNQLAASSTYK